MSPSDDSIEQVVPAVCAAVGGNEAFTDSSEESLEPIVEGQFSILIPGLPLNGHYRRHTTA